MLFIDQLKNVLGISIDSDILLRRVILLRPPIEGNGYDPATLLHPNHFTNTDSREWHIEIPLDLQKQLNEEFRWWFLENHYPTE